MKYVLIGASPYDTLPVFLDDLLQAKIAPDTLVLVEGNPQLLELMVPLAQRLLDDAGKATHVEGTPELSSSLAQADRVLVAAPQRFKGRRAKDMASLSTVLPDPAARDAMADLLRLFRAGAVLRKLWEPLRQVAPGATLLLSQPGAASLVRTVVSFGRMPCLGLETAISAPLTEQRQFRALARLAKVRLEGFSPEGRAAWQQALAGRQNPLMRLALALSGGDAVSVPSLCLPNETLYPGLPRDAVLVMPARVDADGAAPVPGEMLTPEAEARVSLRYPFHTNVARAAALGDRTALREIVEEHPALYGADRLLVLDLMLSLIDAQPDLLPQFA